MNAIHRTFCAVVAGALLGTIAIAAEAPAIPANAPPSLKTVVVPEPPELSLFVSNKAAAIRLGKAFFWDMQVGSDGVTACATCHFHAGADSRSKNQVNPGTLQRKPGDKPAAFSFTPGAGANFHLKPEFFPLRVLTNPADRNSDPKRDTDDIVSSQGVFSTKFVDNNWMPGYPFEEVVVVPDPDGFQVVNVNVRRVEPRHTPTVINAVFNYRNFWDGRAQNEFNGVNQWGDRDPNAFVYKAANNGTLTAVKVRLTNASLASQAVAPIVSAFEMSADGRDGADIGNKFARKKGKKVKNLRPLAFQKVHKDDSVLGSLSRWPDPGLRVDTYDEMIRSAFNKEWWSSNRSIAVVNSDGSTEYFTQMQYNFSLFFGIAIQLYEATLVSNDTPYDRLMEGRGTLSAEAMQGLRIFMESNDNVPGTGRTLGARCINCHAGSEFTDASVASIKANSLTRVRNGQDLDRGFNNIGVRSTLEDVSVGGKDPFGKPLSATAMCRENPTQPFCSTTPPLFMAVDGAFKAPGLRNVELTAPYFHNGGYLTLESVVEFYTRGGDFKLHCPLVGACGLPAVDGTPISPLSTPPLSVTEQTAIIAFLKALTDERVRYRRAPFDHPQLFVPDGQLNDHLSARENPYLPGQAVDRFKEIPPVGRNGGPALPQFLQVLP